MSGTEFTIDHNSDEIAGILNQLLERGTNLSPAMAEIAGYMDGEVAERFKTQTAPDGSAWAELSDRTKEMKAEKGWSADILVGETGHLKGLMHFDYDSNSAWVATGMKASAYAAAHQFGTEGETITVPAHVRRVTKVFGKELPFPVYANVKEYTFTGSTPARPYFGLSDDNKDYITEVLSDFLAGDG